MGRVNERWVHTDATGWQLHTRPLSARELDATGCADWLLVRGIAAMLAWMLEQGR